MFANTFLSQPAELRGTVLALHTLQAEIARTLKHLEANLIVQKETRQTSIVLDQNDVGYTLFGQPFRAKHGNEILIEVLRHFAELDETFQCAIAKR